MDTLAAYHKLIPRQLQVHFGAVLFTDSSTLFGLSMPGDIELAGLERTIHYIHHSKDLSQDSLYEADAETRGPLPFEQELLHGESNTTCQARDPLHSRRFELGVPNSQPPFRWKGKGRQLEATGHYYNNITANDNASVHLGDVFFNYHEAESTEKRILDWLAPIDPSHSHHQACLQYRDGTFLWFFESGRFAAWQASSEFKFSEMIWSSTSSSGINLLVIMSMNWLCLNADDCSASSSFSREADGNLSSASRRMYVGLFATSSLSCNQHVSCFRSGFVLQNHRCDFLKAASTSDGMSKPACSH